MGKTGTQLNAYMRVHRQKINKHPCSEHFDKCAKEDYQVFPFLKLKMNSPPWGWWNRATLFPESAYEIEWYRPVSFFCFDYLNCIRTVYKEARLNTGCLYCSFLFIHHQETNHFRWRTSRYFSVWKIEILAKKNNNNKIR